MKPYPNIDYDFRPSSYWDPSDPLMAALANVNGTKRRQMIRHYWQEGRLEDLDPNLLVSELNDEVRQQLGQIHPSFMGGEYLPHYLIGEVEIARICLQSTTSDVISIRARPTDDGKIAYRVVDEYDATFKLPVPESKQPLSLRELIDQLDHATADFGDLSGGITLGYNNANADDGQRESLRDFTCIESDFYPQLHSHYEHVFDDWVAEDNEPLKGGES